MGHWGPNNIIIDNGIWDLKPHYLDRVNPPNPKHQTLRKPLFGVKSGAVPIFARPLVVHDQMETGLRLGCKEFRVLWDIRFLEIHNQPFHGVRRVQV